MKTLTLQYTDGSNFKCTWDAEVNDLVVRNLPAPDAEGFHDINALGLTVDDIPLIIEYGYDDERDHPFVKIEAIDGVPTEWSEDE